MNENKQIIQARTEYFIAKEKLFKLLMEQSYDTELMNAYIEETKITNYAKKEDQEEKEPIKTNNNPKSKKKSEPLNPAYICPDCSSTDLKTLLFTKNIKCKKCKREAPRDSPIWKNNKIKEAKNE